ncbi:amidohydrolase family protein [Cryptosporangium sp. NPDC051539]|uniref:amidohydrolase family protein n=1 Tax=Cryptosporangium sp. NPDC051539 TaxID=3363962 RepID=UPI00378C57F5
MSAFPRLISADDHVLEPPTLWTDRLPAKYHEIAPHVRRERVKFQVGGKVSLEAQAQASEDGDWADVWYYHDKREPIMLVGAAVGFGHDEVELRPTTFDQVRPGCYDPQARLMDMDIAGVEASLCFPNMAPTRFCGQGFLEAPDRDLALLCVRAYNDFIIDEWCADSGGRLIPLGIIPLWSPELAAQEVRRLAARGNHAICFSEAPARLGLPSIHSGAWEPFFEACVETDTVLMIHVGSSSHVPMPSNDAPMGESNILVTLNAVTAMVDWMFSGLFVRYPTLKICLAECQIGWIPYILQRADEIWEIHGNWAGTRARIPNPPSSYYRSNIFVTFFSDVVGLRNLDAIGADNVLIETDYPHSDSTWPSSQTHFQKQTRIVGLDDPEIIEKIARGNARRLFHLA